MGGGPLEQPLEGVVGDDGLALAQAALQVRQLAEGLRGSCGRRAAVVDVVAQRGRQRQRVQLAPQQQRQPQPPHVQRGVARATLLLRGAVHLPRDLFLGGRGRRRRPSFYVAMAALGSARSR